MTPPTRLAGGAGHERAGGRVHERLELVREARHRAADADAADVRAAAHAVDPAALGHVALDDRAPAAELDQALGRGRTRWRTGPARSSRRGRSPRARSCRRATWAAAPRRAGSSARCPRPGRAGRGWSRRGCPGGSGSRARRRSGCPPSTSTTSRGSPAPPSRRWGCPPWRGCRRRWRRCRRRGSPSALGARRSSHSLVVIGWPVSGLFPKPHQYPSGLIFSLGIEPSTTSTNGSSSPRSALKNHSMKSLLLPDGAVVEVDQRPVHGDLREPRQRPQRDLLDAGLGGRGEGDRVAVAAQSRIDPQDVDDGILGRCGHRLGSSRLWCRSLWRAAPGGVSGRDTYRCARQFGLLWRPMGTRVAGEVGPTPLHRDRGRAGRRLPSFRPPHRR